MGCYFPFSQPNLGDFFAGVVVCVQLYSGDPKAEPGESAAIATSSSCFKIRGRGVMQAPSYFVGVEYYFKEGGEVGRGEN